MITENKTNYRIIMKRTRESIRSRYKRIIFFITVVVTAFLAKYMAEYVLNRNIDFYILATIAVVSVFFLYEILLTVKQTQKQQKNGKDKIEINTIRRVQENLRNVRYFVIQRYEEIMKGSKFHDEKTTNKIMNDPELLELISDLRAGLYTVLQKISITDTENIDRFDIVLKSLRNFSEANISEFMDNLDYISAFFNAIYSEEPVSDTVKISSV